jgi:transposase
VNGTGHQQTEPEFAAVVGVDWADKKHTWSLEAAGGPIEKGEFANDPKAVQQWVESLTARFGNKPIAVGLEQTRGPLLWMLSAYSNLWLYLIHPKTATDVRKAFHPAGTKNDPLDAEVIRMVVVNFRSRLRRWQPDSLEIEQLRSLVHRRRKLVDEITQQTNRLTGDLKVCFPQILSWFDSLDAPIVADFLNQWPSLTELRKAGRAKLLKFFAAHNSHNSARNERRLEEIAEAKPVTEDAAILEPAKIEMRARLQVIAAFRTAIKEINTNIEAIYKSHPDGALFASFPGAGSALAPRLLAAFGSCREHFRSAADMQAYCGIAPVNRASGNMSRTSFRRACPKFLRQTFQEYAAHSIAQCDWAKQFYDEQTARDRGHHVVVRSLAYKWIRIMFRCWVERVPYNEQLHVDNQHNRLSPGELPARSNAVKIQWKTCGGMKRPSKIFY